MRILIDALAYENRYQRGIQRYFYELLSRISSAVQVEAFMSAPQQVALPSGCKLRHLRERFPTSRSNLVMRAWRRFCRDYMPSRFVGNHIFHSTYFTLSPDPGAAEVVTLYDMIPELHTDLCGGWAPVNISMKRIAMERASRILCISHSTATDLARVYPHLKSKSRVIHLGAEHLLSRGGGATRSCSIRSKQESVAEVFFVGNRDQYKNFSVILDAMTDPDWPEQVGMVVAGPPWTSDELRAIQARRLRGRIRHMGRVSDTELAELYRSSAAFIFSSLCEGFGLPILEAQAVGTPVLCSDIPVFREVGGDSPFFFDSRRPSSLATALGQLMADGENLPARREAGIKNVRRFSWQACAEQTLGVYREVSDLARAN